MADFHKHIDLNEIYATLANELDDLYAEGILSAAIYNKKTPKRLLLGAINTADAHICLQLKLSAMVHLFVPAGQSTIFFSRQAEYLQQKLDALEPLQNDEMQYALFITDESYLDIVSVNSEYATAFGELPLQGATGGQRLANSLPEQVEAHGGPHTYQVTGGEIKTHGKPGKRFYVDPVAGKMILSAPFSADMWLRVRAQIAPVRFEVLSITKEDLSRYRIRAPHYARGWLIDRAMQGLLSRRAAAAAGYFDSEAKSRAEAIANRPATGNVIIPGNELSGNYESSFDF